MFCRLQASGASNPFAGATPATTSACASLAAVVTAQLNSLLGSITNKQHRDGIYKLLLANLPAAPPAAAPNSGLAANVGCRRATRATKVSRSPPRPLSQRAVEARLLHFKSVTPESQCFH